MSNTLSFDVHLYHVEIQFLHDPKRYVFTYRDHAEKTIGEVAGIFLNADIMYADNVRILEGEEEKDQKSVFFKGSNIEWIHIKKV